MNVRDDDERVLLSEGSSLTAREHLWVLGRSGVGVDVASCRGWVLGRFSRWCGGVVPVPRSGDDPRGYLRAVGEALGRRAYRALLPTHEQAWLFAAGRRFLPGDAAVAVSSLEAFDHVQGKIACARFFDELGLPQPGWSVLTDPEDVRRLVLPCWLKAEFSTAGRGVRLVATTEEAERAARLLLAAGPVMVQQPAAGAYAQVAGLFSHGRLVAAHTSELVAIGAGGSAAARLSVDHPLARTHIEALGRALRWHGGLTLDYLHVDGRPTYIEANPRTVEPANAAASGVDLPRLTIALSRGDELPATPVIGRAGVRTHGALALALGTAETTGSRRATIATLGRALTRRGALHDSCEVLTPVSQDPPSLLPLIVVAAQVVAAPDRGHALTASAVRDYAVTPAAIDSLRL